MSPDFQVSSGISAGQGSCQVTSDAFRSPHLGQKLGKNLRRQTPPDLGRDPHFGELVDGVVTCVGAMRCCRSTDFAFRRHPSMPDGFRSMSGEGREARQAYVVSRRRASLGRLRRHALPRWRRPATRLGRNEVEHTRREDLQRDQLERDRGLTPSNRRNPLPAATSRSFRRAWAADSTHQPTPIAPYLYSPTFVLGRVASVQS